MTVTALVLHRNPGNITKQKMQKYKPTDLLYTRSDRRKREISMLDIQNHRPLRELVYEELKNRILTGDIPPGTRLMEVDLAEDLGVSRTPVREAIRKLEKENLVTIEPRKGAYASKLEIKDVIDILEVRQQMEGFAAALAAERITEEGIEKLSQANDNYKKAVLSGDASEMIKYDTMFHKIIVDACDNNILDHMIVQLQDLVLRFRYMYYEDESRSKKQPGEHRLIIDALISGDAEKSQSSAEQHILHLKEFVIEEGVG